MGSEAMEPSKSSSKEQLSVTFKGIDLPQEKEEREEFLSELTQTIQQTVQEQEKPEPDQVTINEGHQFSYLPAECPRCGEDPHILNLTTLSEDESIANAKFECRHCSYTGGAKYRLVDIETNKYNSDRGAEEYRSIVAEGDVKPEYHSY